MYFRRERNFLKSLCKGQIHELVEEVGWNPIQCAIVKKKCLEFKSMPVICIEIGLSESQYTRHLNEICQKLTSYMAHNKNEELAKIYNSF